MAELDPTVKIDNEKKDLISGKPRKNIFLILIGIAVAFAVVFSFFNNSTKSGDEANTKEQLNEKKVKDSTEKANSMSIEDLTKKVEREKPQEVKDNEELIKLKADIEKAKKANKDALNNPPVSGNDSVNGIPVGRNGGGEYVDEKTRHAEAVANSAIFAPSGNASNKKPTEVEDELSKLYKEQNERIKSMGNVKGDDTQDSANGLFTPHQVNERDGGWLKDQSKQDYKQDKSSLEKSNNVNNTIYEGTLLHVVMQQATSSDMPGKFKVHTTRPVYSKNGKVLLPQGSTVLGMANTNVKIGQERVQTAFYRIITPKGDTVYQSGMQGIDEDGTIGVHGDVNNHFFKIFSSSFGVALIQSLFTKTDNSTTVNNPSGSVTIKTAAAETLGDVAKTQLERNKDIPPTISLVAGQEFNITIVKDIVIENP